MDFKSLNNKNIVNDKVVMTEPTLLFLDGVDSMVEHIVDRDQLGRPDLISLKYYGVQSLTDMLLKFNGISNPFLMTEGMIILIPVNQSKFKAFIKPSRKTAESQKEKFIKQRRMTEQDKKRFEFLQNIAESEALPPNRLKTGQTNKDAKSGIITDLNPSRE